MMNRLLHFIQHEFGDMIRVCHNEFRLIFADMGVVLFFFILPLFYPLVYSSIYDPELVREVPVVIIDNSHTPLSREWMRSLAATQEVSFAGYAIDLPDAKRAMAEKQAFGIVELPADLSERVGRGEQANINIYCDMGLLLRYKSILVAVTNASSAMAAKEQARAANITATYVPLGAMPVQSQFFPLGNPMMGIASALLPGILMIVVQQSMILGICMLGAGARGRRRRNAGRDPEAVPAGIIPTMAGKLLCYSIIYIPVIFYVAVVVIRFFEFPHNGSMLDIFLMTLPYLASSAFFGMTLQAFVTEREDVFPLIVWTSVLFLFLSGISWPRYGMPALLKFVGDLVPSTWAVNAFVRMTGNAASLSDVSFELTMMWVLAGVYFLMAYAYRRLVAANPLKY